MKRSVVALVVVSVLAMVLTACGGSDNNAVLLPTGPTLGKVIASPSVNPVTSFGQTLATHDTDTFNSWVAPFPGEGNVWNINNDFDLDDGGDDQFDWALQVTVGSTLFPYDQTYGELTFYTPTMGSSTGLKTATVSDGEKTTYSAITGTYSAFLNSTSDSRLLQTLDLRSAPSGTITLTWDEDITLNNGYISGYTSSSRVVVRSTAGVQLQQLYTTNVDDFGSFSADLTAYRGQRIVLSFEHRTMPDAWGAYVAIIDNVSVQDSAAKEYVTNGDFETGDMTGWTANTPAEVQNMTSGVRTLEGLDVTRSFYTVPNKLWGRWVDVYSNPTGSDISTTVTYYTNLGSDSDGIIYSTPSTSNKSLTSWDGSAYDRDVALVHGIVSSETYTSATALNYHSNNATTGSDDIYFTYDITVPAGGNVAIVNFIIMGTYDTGLTAADTAAKATEVDTEAAKIVSHFWSDSQYRTGMTKEQISAIKNF